MYKSMEIWLPAYLRQALSGHGAPQGTVTICLAVADHFEPFWAGADRDLALNRVRSWQEELPRLVEGVTDCRGRPPQHDFFYPVEEYDPQILDMLAGICSEGLGAVEVHLHHHGETSSQLEDILLGYAETLHERHGLLEREQDGGKITYGFIHGNWALDNSRPDGKWCGVNDEISILARTGCYADFTLPSAPSPTQTSTINSIYYATDDPMRPKSHDKGRPAAVGVPASGDLLMVQGVLALDWNRRKWGMIPRLETSDLSWHMPPLARRIPLWLKFAPIVRGAPDVRFLKLSCHGAQEDNSKTILGKQTRDFFKQLCRSYNDGQNYRLLFLTCREMVRAIHALERGEGLPW